MQNYVQGKVYGWIYQRSGFKLYLYNSVIAQLKVKYLVSAGILSLLIQGKQTSCQSVRIKGKAKKAYN